MNNPVATISDPTREGDPRISMRQPVALPYGTELFLKTDEDIADARRFRAFVGAMLAEINHQDYDGPALTPEQERVGQALMALGENSPQTIDALRAAIDAGMGE